VASVATPGRSVGEAETELVELDDHLVEAFLPEVRDVEQVVRGALHELTNRLDLSPTQAVAGPLGEIERLDGQLEIG
jgi:hypothetical protein